MPGEHAPGHRPSLSVQARFTARCTQNMGAASGPVRGTEARMGAFS